jgi:hypothetical protein
LIEELKTRKYMKNLCLALLFLSTTALAQKDVAKFFPAGAGDVANGQSGNVQRLIEGYLKPISEDFGALANNGWYTTAATHKKWGFDFNVTVNTISITSESKSFAVPTLNGLTYQGTPGSTNNQLPTAYGAAGQFPAFIVTNGPDANRTFLGPDGGDISKDLPVGAVAIPTFQVGLGLFANTDIRVRYSPELSINNVKLSNWGVALMHDVKQHIPGLKELPFSLSLLVGYTKLAAVTDLQGFYSGSGQEGRAESSSYTAQLLVGKTLPVISFYAAVGYDGSTTTNKITGTYNVSTANGAPLLAPFVLTDPFSKEFTSGGFRATGGLRLKFGPVMLNSDYSFVNAKGLLTAGFGFTFR